MGRSLLQSATIVLALVLPFGSAAPRGLHKARVIKEPGELEESYDYVIVGAGTAGLTIADRLTEDEDVTVLVVEYGLLSARLPKIATVQGGFSGMDSAFMFPTQSVPQVNLGNRRTAVLAGKVVGGSSAVNAMMTIRGSKGDYNRWGNFFSDESEWSWEGLLPYFKRALTFVPPNDDVATESEIIYDTSYWGNSSGVYTSWPSFQYPGTAAQVEAWKVMDGVNFTPTAALARQATGHYSNLDRSNYHLVTNSKVIRVDVEDGTATGVAFRPGDDAAGEVTTIAAKKEVIISAGAVHTPQIMQLSGLGPKDILEEAGIEVKVELPGVGKNFQDHPMLTARFTLRNFNFSPSGSDLVANGEFRDWANEVWEKNRTGPYSIATGNAAAWLSFPTISERYEEVATLLEEQEHAAYLPEGTDETVAAGYAAQMKSYAEALRSNHTAFYNLVFTSGPSNGILVDLHPLSRGTINVDPADPEGSEPLVDYRALTNPLDSVIMADILRYTRKFYLENSVNAEYEAAESQPGARVQTDEEMAAYLQQTLSPTEYHPAGTCAMMPLELGGVVDEQLKVYGVKNLRIADASIIPTLPGANTCQTVYAIGEKAADLIKAGASSGDSEEAEEEAPEVEEPEVEEPEDPETEEPESD
ncbi:unnamed protein product [Parascedosporium putredinis]|uniref:Glucose-methanol-choline oxidoreductase N-terminal domain-containing protein n=1 Tax=Parascedosporium putredinis TaxID=1442378 RepID=A0A9P1H579_9PEZI|nr:unnamed protein product [Parascedosporium putredinis]CAI7996155.1 unnamed protein product [Parascedosporium putredinis]